MLVNVFINLEQFIIFGYICTYLILQSSTSLQFLLNWVDMSWEQGCQVYCKKIRGQLNFIIPGKVQIGYKGQLTPQGVQKKGNRTFWVLLSAQYLT